MQTPEETLARITGRARQLYAAHIAGKAEGCAWWDAVIVTASSRQQAEQYRWEIHRRQSQGKLPRDCVYLVAPDVSDRRMGSGGATLNALAALGSENNLRGGPRDWWSSHRALIVHAGGDPRRLPQFSLSGKLFTALPVRTAWGELSTLFDEMLALSTTWLERLPAGLMVGAGDVLFVFDPAQARWDRPGVNGFAMRQPAEAAVEHGVYVVDEQGRVYGYLQKPSVAAVDAAGGLLPGNQAALDLGLLHFDSDIAARLSELAAAGLAGNDGCAPAFDLYEHVTLSLTGQWSPAAGDPALLRAVADALKGAPFWCSIVSGSFTHLGTTRLFRSVITEQSDFARLYAAQQRAGTVPQRGLRSSGVVVDSVLPRGGEILPGAVVIECALDCPVRAGRGSVLHGLEGLPSPVDVPDDTVVHQVPVRSEQGSPGTVIRVYGVTDDPKAEVSAWKATWLGRPIIEHLRSLDLDLAKVWPGLPASEWTLWNARLFPVTTVEEAWDCARWLMGLPSGYSAAKWESAPERMSLESSSASADREALEAARTRRLEANWTTTAVALANAGADLRPLLAYSPGPGPLAETGRRLVEEARPLNAESPTESASRHFQASLFLGQAGLVREAEESREMAFRMVQRAIESGGAARPSLAGAWLRQGVVVEAPVRLDFGGGWSDTPPFCLDWGGTVLNAAVELNGGCPIRARARRIEEKIVRCVSERDPEPAEVRVLNELPAQVSPGDPFAIPIAALRMTGLFDGAGPLEATLDRMGGGIEITISVNLPMGSGLGTSSILAAAVVRALLGLLGHSPEPQELSEQVLRIEQAMTTGGGWQDQAGGIYPGIKLVTSGPGCPQRLRVQPIRLTPEREAEFHELLVLYYTGIRRIARGLLRQVVGSYLARETAAIQVLHSIKTLALEMGYALQEGEWDYLGRLLDRHWELNQVLDPHTTNAPINALLTKVRPYVRGAKLAGAGGGGFLILLAKSREAAGELKSVLAQDSSGGALFDCRLSARGLRAEAE